MTATVGDAGERGETVAGRKWRGGMEEEKEEKGQEKNVKRRETQMEQKDE